MNIRLRSAQGWENPLSVDQSVTTFGTHPGCDVRITEGAALPVHFQLLREKDRLYLMPFASNLAVRRNGETFPVSDKTLLEFGDAVICDGLTVELESASQAVPSSRRRKPFLIAGIVLIFLLLLLGTAALAFPRIDFFRAETIGSETEYSWATRGFLTTVTLDLGDGPRPVPAQGTLRRSNLTSGQERATARLSVASPFFFRTVGAELAQPTTNPIISETVTVAAPTSTVTATVVPTRTGTAPVISVQLMSEAIAPNRYRLHWEIIGTSLTRATLRIGTQSESIRSINFCSEKTVHINETTTVELRVVDGKVEKSQSLELVHVERKPQIDIFAVWTVPDETQPGALPIKIAECVPDASAEGGCRVRVAPNVVIDPGTRVRVEWQLQDTDSLTIEPLSSRTLPPLGEMETIVPHAMSFILSAVADEKRIDVSLPVPVRSKSETRLPGVASGGTATKPKIEFFTANPTTVGNERQTILAWSVTGPYSAIRLLSSDGGTEPVPLSGAASTYLPADGFLTVPVTKDVTFMLQALLGTETVSAVETVRFAPKTETSLRDARITLRSIFPERDSYVVGETITVSADVRALRDDYVEPTGSILVSDGVSSCLISLPKNSCELLLRAAGSRKLTLRYGGDSVYRSASMVHVVSVTLPEKLPVNLALLTLNNQTVYTVGEKIYLSATGLADDATGTLYFSDGFRSCQTTLPKNHCELTALPSAIPGSPVLIRVGYSGDTRYENGDATVMIETHPEPTSTATVFPVKPTMTVPIAPIPTQLRILKIYPERKTYHIGDSIEVFIALENDADLEGGYSSKVKISDGVSVCYLNPNSANSCSLRLVHAQTGAVTASYPGDARFTAAEADPVPLTTAELPKAATKTEILSVLPTQQEYRLGDTLTVSVRVTPVDATTKKPTGIVTVTDGEAECTVTLGVEDSCALTLKNPSATELRAGYSGDDTFGSSVAAPVSLRLNLLRFFLTMMAKTTTGCERYSPDPVDPIEAKINQQSSSPELYFTLDERFRVGNGFFIRFAVETYVNVFPATAGTVDIRLCSVADPTVCFEETGIPVLRHETQDYRGEVLIDVPTITRSGMMRLELTFHASDPKIGSRHQIVSVDGIFPGQLFFGPANLPSTGIPDSPIVWPAIDAAPNRDRTLSFTPYLLLGSGNDCVVPLDAASYPAPRFDTVQVVVAPSVPGSDLPDRDWQERMREQNVSESQLAQMQLNSQHWGPERCHFVADGSWRLDCQQVGLTEPSRLRFGLNLYDENYRVWNLSAVDGLSDLVNEIPIARTPVAILMSPEWRSVLVGDVYWLNSRGEGFNVWAAPDCEPVQQRGYQTSSTRIPDERKLTYELKNLSRAASNALTLSSLSDELLPEFRGALTPVETYHGVCGSCQPKEMMNYTWIPNTGCPTIATDAVRLTQKSGKLFGGTMCELTQYRMINVQSDFCQLRFTGGDLTVSIPETAETLATSLTFPVGSRAVGMSLSEPFSPLAAYPDPLLSLETVPLSDLQPIVEIAGVPALVTPDGFPVNELRVGEPVELRLSVNGPIPADLRATLTLPEWLTRESLDFELSDCLARIDLFESGEPTLTFHADDFNPESVSGVSDFHATETFTARCRMTFRNATQGPQPFRPVRIRIFAAGYPDFVTDWAGLPGEVFPEKVTVVPSLTMSLGDGTEPMDVLSDGTVARWLPSFTNDGFGDLPRYMLTVMSRDRHGNGRVLKNGEAIVLTSPLFEKLADFGSLPDWLERLPGGEFRWVSPDVPATFSLPPFDWSGFDPGTLTIRLDSANAEGETTIRSTSDAFAPELIPVRVEVPESRYIGQPALLRLTVSETISPAARAWLDAQQRPLFRVEVLSGAATVSETCLSGFAPDETGVAVCDLNESVNITGIISEEVFSEPLILKLIADCDTIEPFGIQWIDGIGLPLDGTLTVAPLRKNPVTVSISQRDLNDEPLIVGRSTVLELTAEADPALIASASADGQMPVRLAAPLFERTDVDGSCLIVNDLPWTPDADQPGIWRKRCDFRALSPLTLSPEERQLALILEPDASRFELSEDSVATLTLSETVERRPGHWAITLPGAEEGLDDNGEKYFKIQLDGDTSTFPILLTSDIDPAEMDDSALRFEGEALSVADCFADGENGLRCTGTILELRDSYTLTAVYDGSEWVEPGRSEPVRFSLRRSTLRFVSAQPPQFNAFERLPDDGIEGETTETPEPIYVERERLRDNLYWDVNLTGDDLRLVDERAFTVTFRGNFGDWNTTEATPCDVMLTPSDVQLRCEMSAANVDALRRLDALTIAYPGDVRTEPFELTMPAGTGIILAELLPGELVLLDGLLQTDWNGVALEMLTIRCVQPGVMLRCFETNDLDETGAELNCSEMRFDVRDLSELWIKLFDDYDPMCERIGEDADGRVYFSGSE